MISGASNQSSTASFMFARRSHCNNRCNDNIVPKRIEAPRSRCISLQMAILDCGNNYNGNDDFALRVSSSCPFSSNKTSSARNQLLKRLNSSPSVAEATSTTSTTTKSMPTITRRMNCSSAAASSLKRGVNSMKLGTSKRRFLIDTTNGPLAYYSNHLLAKRGIPILFILVCSLIIVNTKCDQVGSANEETTSKIKPTNDLLDQDELDSTKSQSSTTQKSKLDPLNMLREIYLDHNSKVITMLLPPEGDPVQKFHPNGRYGRRSVDNFAESHAELGKLVYNEPLSTSSMSSLASPSSSPLSSPSSSSSSAASSLLAPSSSGELKALLHQLSREMSSSNGGGAASRLLANNRYGTVAGLQQNNNMAGGGPLQANGAPLVNYHLEMNKLLKCNYSGIANLYWCNSSAS